MLELFDPGKLSLQGSEDAALLPKVLIADFGGQYTQLIARRLREIGYLSLVLPASAKAINARSLEALGIKALILSGGPASAYETEKAGKKNKLGAAKSKKKEKGAINKDVFDRGLPILGICYGMQYLAQCLGGKTNLASRFEYGAAEIVLQTTLKKNATSHLYKGAMFKDKQKLKVWMSHSDVVTELPKNPKGFEVSAYSYHVSGGLKKEKKLMASFENLGKRIYGMQFHPEVSHTAHGMRMLQNFLSGVSGLKKTWRLDNFLASAIKAIQHKVKDKHVLLGVSGGVDSTVLAVLLKKALRMSKSAGGGKSAGGRPLKGLTPVLVDTGLLRLGELDSITSAFQKQLGINILVIKAEKRMLQALKGVRDSERKRKIIGRVFVETFFKHAPAFDFLAQGTLYPDVIESASIGDLADVIKTHHNRVKEILQLEKAGSLLEPFAGLFKDEVRKLGGLLKIPSFFLERQPFPGPGLAVRIMGEVTKEKLDLLRSVENIVSEEVEKEPVLRKIWQFFAVLLEQESLGVTGDHRHVGKTIVLRSVDSADGMTADFVLPQKEFLRNLVRRITGEVPQVARVVLDITSKPPATIEWE